MVKFLIRHLEVYYKVDRLLSDDSILHDNSKLRVSITKKYSKCSSCYVFNEPSLVPLGSINSKCNTIPIFVKLIDGDENTLQLHDSL